MRTNEMGYWYEDGVRNVRKKAKVSPRNFGYPGMRKESHVDNYEYGCGC